MDSDDRCFTLLISQEKIIYKVLYISNMTFPTCTHNIFSHSNINKTGLLIDSVTFLSWYLKQ